MDDSEGNYGRVGDRVNRTRVESELSTSKAGRGMQVISKLRIVRARVPAKPVAVLVVFFFLYAEKYEVTSPGPIRLRRIFHAHECVTFIAVRSPYFDYRKSY